VADRMKYKNGFQVGLFLVVVVVFFFGGVVVIWVYHWMKNIFLTQGATWVLRILFWRDSKD